AAGADGKQIGANGNTGAVAGAVAAVRGDAPTDGSAHPGSQEGPDIYHLRPPGRIQSATAESHPGVLPPCTHSSKETQTTTAKRAPKNAGSPLVIDHCCPIASTDT